MNTRSFLTSAVAIACAAVVGIAAESRPARAADAGPVKIAVVDIQRAVLETEDGLRALATLKKYGDRRTMELSSRQDDLNRRKDEIEKQSKVLSKEALAKAIDDWQRQMTEFNGLYVEYGKESQKKQQDITAPIFARVSGLLRKLAQKEGYDMILERQAVPYARTDLDVTDQVIAMYNSGDTGAEPAPSGTTPAAPAASDKPAPAPSK